MFVHKLKFAIIALAALGLGACNQHTKMAFSDGTKVEVLSHENVGAFTGSRVDFAQVCQKSGGAYVNIPTSKGPAIPIRLKREQCKLVIATSHGGTGVFPGLVTPVAAAAVFGAAMPATNIAVQGGTAIAKASSRNTNINTNTQTQNNNQLQGMKIWNGGGSHH